MVTPSSSSSDTATLTAAVAGLVLSVALAYYVSWGRKLLKDARERERALAGDVVISVASTINKSPSFVRIYDVILERDFEKDRQHHAHISLAFKVFSTRDGALLVRDISSRRTLHVVIFNTIAAISYSPSSSSDNTVFLTPPSSEVSSSTSPLEVVAYSRTTLNEAFDESKIKNVTLIGLP
jgi:hypothetical protein